MESVKWHRFYPIAAPQASSDPTTNHLDTESSEQIVKPPWSKYTPRGPFSYKPGTHISGIQGKYSIFEPRGEMDYPPLPPLQLQEYRAVQSTAQQQLPPYENIHHPQPQYPQQQTVLLRGNTVCSAFPAPERLLTHFPDLMDSVPTYGMHPLQMNPRPRLIRVAPGVMTSELELRSRSIMPQQQLRNPFNGVGPSHIAGLGKVPGLSPKTGEKSTRGRKRSNANMQEAGPPPQPSPSPKQLYLLCLAQQGLTTVPARGFPAATLPGFPEKPSARKRRTTTFVVPTTSIQVFATNRGIVDKGCTDHLRMTSHFTETERNDVIVLFDGGKQLARLDKHYLQEHSPFFARELDGPLLESQTLCIRLRDDFPAAIPALISFVCNGSYTFSSSIKAEYPHITILDLHVHAYTVATKYEVTKMRDYAITQYAEVAAAILSMDFLVDANDNEDLNPRGQHENKSKSTSQESTPKTETPNAPYPSPSALLAHLLHSITLLYKTTSLWPSQDNMRATVLELLKPKLNDLIKVRFFVMMVMKLEGFGKELVESLESDGLEVFVVEGRFVGRRKGGVRFDCWG